MIQPQTDGSIDSLAPIFKILADPARLRILGVLAARPHSRKELASALNLTAPTISHHMARLIEIGLVVVAQERQMNIYSLNAPLLREISSGTATAQTDGNDGPNSALSPEQKERTKVIRNFFDGSRLKKIPRARKKRVIVLQHLLSRFDPERTYPEKEVNDLLRDAHEDVATLRRELVDYQFMTRDNGNYHVSHTAPLRSVQVAQEIIGDERAWFRALMSNAIDKAP